MKKPCRWNLNCSLHRLISFKGEIGREGHFLNKRTLVCSLQSPGGARVFSAPGSYVSACHPTPQHDSLKYGNTVAHDIMFDDFRECRDIPQSELHATVCSDYSS